MISTMLAMTLATAVQSDSTRASRLAYQGCLRQFMNRSVQARTAVGEFQTALSRECATEAAAYRAAVLQRETSLRATRGAAEETAEQEVGEARELFLEHYRSAMEPQ